MISDTILHIKQIIVWDTSNKKVYLKSFDISLRFSKIGFGINAPTEFSKTWSSAFCSQTKPPTKFWIRSNLLYVLSVTNILISGRVLRNSLWQSTLTRNWLKRGQLDFSWKRFVYDVSSCVKWKQKNILRTFFDLYVLSRNLLRKSMPPQNSPKGGQFDFARKHNVLKNLMFEVNWCVRCQLQKSMLVIFDILTRFSEFCFGCQCAPKFTEKWSITFYFKS